MSNIQKGKELIAILRKIEIRLSLLKKRAKYDNQWSEMF